MATGEETEAFVHLYEAMPGTRLTDIVRLDEAISDKNVENGYGQLHPLTPEASAFLLGDAGFGQESIPQSSDNPHATSVGQRFYYLETPGKRPLTIPTPNGHAKGRHPSRLRLALDFPKNQIRAYLFLSEIRAQEIAVKLRQNSHTGVVIVRLKRHIERGLKSALKGTFKRLKILHEAVTPDQWILSLGRLPSLVPQIFQGHLMKWIVKGLTDHFKKHTGEFIKAAEDTADGVTIVITLGNPPGLPQLRTALKGKLLSLANLKFSEGEPAIDIKILPGYTHE
jgi:hypothetical protein